MKRRIVAIMLGAMLVFTGANITGAPLTAQAEELTYGDFTYTLSGGLTITGYTGNGGKVVIPDQINGVDVTKIDWNVFNGRASITEITLPSKLQEIGDYAFEGTGITSIKIPKTVTKAANAFDGAEQLTTVEIESGETVVPESTFKGAENLTTIKLPDSLREIRSDAFNGCSRLSSIDLPDNITTIGWNAFNGCTSLTEITLPSKLQEIGDYAFDGAGITSIKIPKNVTKAANAFDGAEQLTTAELESGETVVPESTFKGAENLTTIKLPDSLREIKSDGFNGCSRLSSINLPDKVTTIGWNAFNGCTSLTEITLPSKLQEIGDYAFDGAGITSIKIPKTVTKAANAFDGAEQLTTAEIESGATVAPEGIFKGAENLTTVKLPESIEEIESDSFNGCSRLKSINLPDKLAKMGWNVFYGCSALDKLTISPKVIEIGEYAFDDCSSLTIYGEKDSYVETYAKKNNIPFVELSSNDQSADDYTNDAPSIKIKSIGKNNIKIKYSKPVNTSKFEFNYRKKNSSGWKKKITKKTSINLKGLKRKTSYKIRVRSIRTVDGADYYGEWSDVKTVKTK